MVSLLSIAAKLVKNHEVCKHIYKVFTPFVSILGEKTLTLHPLSKKRIKKDTIIMAQEDVFKKIVSHCKEYGFVFPSSEIYDGLGAVYDYGQNGV